MTGTGGSGDRADADTGTPGTGPGGSGVGATDRAVTVTLNYVLVLGITATLVAGLLVAGGTFVEDQRERVIEDELNVIGNHIAGDIEQVDRMVRAGASSPSEAEINQTFQQTVSGTAYDVELQANPDQVVLTSNSPSVTVRVNVTTQTDIGESFAFGGETSVQYDTADDEVVIVDG
jgi:hypothetical protein